VSGLAPAKACAAPGCAELRPCSVHGARFGHSAAERREREPWRKLYDTARWKLLRRRVLMREPTCPACKAAGRRPSPTVDVHHVHGHNHGDRRLFFDEKQLTALCHPCHAAITAREVLRR